MTVRSECARKFFEKSTICACGASLTFSILEENAPLKRASNPMTFVKFVRYELWPKPGPVLHLTGPPDKSQMRAPRPPKYAAKKSTCNMYDKKRV